MILLPVEDADTPKGSQISDERVQQIEKKIGEYKEQMRQEATRQQQQQAPAKQPAGPKPVKPG